jgi:hypothetical protein
MEKIKTIVDREPVSSDYIEAKQDFGHVLSQVKNLKPPVWKTAWFYGPVGIAVVAVIVSITTLDPIIEIPTENASITIHDELIEHLNQPESSTTVQVGSIQESSPPQVSYTATPIEESPAVLPQQEIEVEPIETQPTREVEVVNVPIQTNRNASVPAPVRKNRYPHIEYIFNGEDIPFETLSSENGIQLNDEIKIVAFDIHYNVEANSTETASVVGNKIPKRVLDKIKRYNIGYMIFITDVKGVDANGKVYSIDNINYIVMN